ncbi:MAG: hypothetical protein KF835_14410 [Xanthobacteraceae bacterium]|nr:hypothetical protein [Xanthobacteraceae bacterium]
MNAILWVIGALALWLIYSVLKYNFWPKPHEVFWRAVGRNPELALALLTGEEACVFSDNRPTGDYTGPFFLNTIEGQTVKFYVRFHDIEKMQLRITAKLLEHEAASRR